jgi:hypothetical protein
VVHRPDNAAYSTPIPPGDEDSFCTDLPALETLRRRLPAICQVLFGYAEDEERGMAWVLDTAIAAVRNANRVPCCRPYLLSGIRTFLRSAFDHMAALRRAAWRAPTLVAPRPPSILSRDFRGEDKLAADLEYAIEIGRREDMTKHGASSPLLLASMHPPIPPTPPLLPSRGCPRVPWMIEGVPLSGGWVVSRRVGLSAMVLGGVLGSNVAPASGAWPSAPRAEWLCQVAQPRALAGEGSPPRGWRWVGIGLLWRGLWPVLGLAESRVRAAPPKLVGEAVSRGSPLRTR